MPRASPTSRSRSGRGEPAIGDGDRGPLADQQAGRGRDEYLTRRRRLLLSTAHLMEIDLLRGGKRVPMRSPSPAPYFVFLSRSESRPNTKVWPIPLDSPLPVVPVPLLPGDPDVPLDLQLALTTLYDLLGYDLAVDYTRPPQVPLRPEAAAWAEDRLRASAFVRNAVGEVLIPTARINSREGDHGLGDGVALEDRLGAVFGQEVEAQQDG